MAGEGRGGGASRAVNDASTVLPEQLVKDGGLTGRRPPVPLLLALVTLLRLGLVPDRVVGDLLAGALDPVARRGQQVVRVLGADLV